eukprot:GFKZ01005773.1.p1 GENE.GFKZ01005773.1~~GFKZ01005773.1.p1  ORF type:complete len:513 (+),score=39.30 GFKZ01005773.1:203-1741(+)
MTLPREDRVNLPPAPQHALVKRHRFCAPTFSGIALVIAVSIATLVLTSYIMSATNTDMNSFSIPLHSITSNNSNTSLLPVSPSSTDVLEERARALETPHTWLQYLRNYYPKGVKTERIGCREMQAGGQSCVFEGFTCINTSSHKEFGRPEVYFLADNVPDGREVRGDNWCRLRHQSADPRYFASRHWPILEDTFIPQRSCLRALYRTQNSLFGGSDLSTLNIKWLDSLWLVDLDYIDNSHNNHLVKDIIWLLDVVLWQKGMDLRRRPGDVSTGEYSGTAGHLFSEGPQHIYLPQGEEDFNRQTSKDVNRLTYSLILQRDLAALYPNFTAEDMKRPPTERRNAAPLLVAFPDIKNDERLLFHRDMIEKTPADLVCTPRFTSGAKIGNGAHERVCRYIRQRSYEFYGIQEPPMRRLGALYHPQPPKRLMILQRHVTRALANLKELEAAFRAEFEPHGVEVEVVSTKDIITAEDHVRTFSRAGVLFTSHGSQAMGQMWMPRHRYDASDSVGRRGG